MTTTSPLQQFSLPELTNTPNAPAQLSTLVGQIERKVIMRFASTAARDAAMVLIGGAELGMYAEITTTPPRLTHYNGSAWETVYYKASYTPTITNAAIGTGGSASNVANYAFAFGSITVRGKFILGSSGMSVSGGIILSMPAGITLDFNDASEHFGLCHINDTGTGSFEGKVQPFNSTSVRLQVSNAAGTYLSPANTAAGVPMTWASTDYATYDFTALASAT